MSKSTTSYFPDINVWLALVYEGHEHHATARDWFETVEDGMICFSRFTQMGFLRLLTHASIMQSDVRTLQQAWHVYDVLSRDGRISFAAEPAGEEVETVFRRFSSGNEISPKKWSDAYLAAFTAASQMELVTFDRALSRLSIPVVFLH